MAVKKAKQTVKNGANSQRADKPKPAVGKKGSLMLYAAAAVVIIAIVAVAAYVISNNGSSYTGVSFSTFKANLDSANTIALVLMYSNDTQLSSEIPCSNYIIEVLSNKRSPSTMSFFEINQTSCVYSPNGLGHTVNPAKTNASACLNEAQSEPSIFLNYTGANASVITADHMYVSGNLQYYAKCPIAVDLT